MAGAGVSGTQTAMQGGLVMAPALAPYVVDWLLYNRRELRELVAGMEPPGSTGLVKVAVGHRPQRSEVEYVALSRATISTVLDAVDRAVAKLPRALRRLARLRYEHNLTVYELARYVHWSERSCYRKLDEIRVRVASSLSLVDNVKMADFWQKVGRLLAG